jgi:hypothetical protein
MTKLKNPLLSFQARGALGDIVLTHRGGRHIAEATPKLKDRKTLAQLSWRTMFQLAIEWWHTLTSAEKQAWENSARPLHLSGYDYFMSQALRPNPGIYLPLAGGTMSGDIVCASHKITQLPDPIASQDPVTKAYFEAHVPAGPYTEGARVYNSVDISIPSGVNTYLTFNSERYDTDTIHSLISNTGRLTCHHAGIYLIIGQVNFDTGGASRKLLFIRLNGTTFIGINEHCDTAVGYIAPNVTSIYQLALTDYVELGVMQNTGVAKNVQVNLQRSPEFMIQRIG